MTRKMTADVVVSVVLYRPDLKKLRECLDSVIASTGVRVAVYLLDNSPEPLDDGFLADYAGRVNYVFHGKNVGFGAGHNLVMARAAKEHAGTPYFLILNPDAYFDPDLLPAMKARMDADMAVGLAIPRIVNPDGSIQLVNKRLPSPAMLFLRPWLEKHGLMRWMFAAWGQRYLLQDMDLSRPLVCPFISGCFMFFRFPFLRELGGFDERYFLYMEDVDLSRRAAARGLNVVFSDLECRHYWERGIYKSKYLFRLMVESATRYFNKWGWLWDPERARLNRGVRYYEGPLS